MSTHFDDLLGPTPESYGFPEKPSLSQRDCWVRQEHFLEAFAKCGKLGTAATAIGVSRTCVERWQAEDLYGFRKRLDQAHQAYVEFLEQLMDDRLENPQGNRGSDILLMFKMKAEAPHKYREDVKVVGIDASNMMLDKLREMAGKDLQRQPELESPAVEGVFKEVPQQKPEGVWPPPPNEVPPVPPESPPRESPRESARARRAAQVRAAQAARRQPSGRMIRR
jgi:hypothetical protein